MRWLTAFRTALGAVLLWRPSRLVTAAGGHPDDRTTRALARILGVRHLVQAAVFRRGRRACLGAAVDAAHLASLLVVAACRPRWRRVALTDAGLAAALCGAGLALGRT